MKLTDKYEIELDHFIDLINEKTKGELKAYLTSNTKYKSPLFLESLIEKLYSTQNWSALDAIVEFIIKDESKLNIINLVNDALIKTIFHNVSASHDNRQIASYEMTKKLFNYALAREELSHEILEKMFYLALCQSDHLLIAHFIKNDDLCHFINDKDAANNMFPSRCRTSGLRYSAEFGNRDLIRYIINHPLSDKFFNNYNIKEVILTALSNNQIECAILVFEAAFTNNSKSISHIESFCEMLNISNGFNNLIKSNDSISATINHNLLTIFSLSIALNCSRTLSFIINNYPFNNDYNIDILSNHIKLSIHKAFKLEYFEVINLLIDFDIELLTSTFSVWISDAFKIIEKNNQINSQDLFNNDYSNSLSYFVNNLFSKTNIASCFEHHHLISYNLENSLVINDKENQSNIESIISIFQASRKKPPSKILSSYHLKNISYQSESLEKKPPEIKKTNKQRLLKF